MRSKQYLYGCVVCKELGFHKAISMDHNNSIFNVIRHIPMFMRMDQGSLFLVFTDLLLINIQLQAAEKFTWWDLHYNLHDE